MKKLTDAIRNNTANGITCLNLVCGAVAIVLSFSTFDDSLFGLKGYQVAMLFIALAAVADFFDGFVARLLHASSPLGKELDSLSDCVSFGLAPAMMLFNVMRQAEPSSLWCWATLLIPVAGALRLARFNIDTRQSTVFTGLPIPANALFWIGFVQYYATHQELSLWLVVGCIVLLSWLMVCNLRMFSLKLHSLSVKENYRQWLLVLCFVCSVAFAGVTGFAVTIALYVLLSALFPSKDDNEAPQTETEA